MNTVRCYAFSETATEKPPMEIENPKQFLTDKYDRGCFFGLDNLQKFGCYKLSGWSYDFRPFLKRFVVKQYDSWQEYFAPNKTLLRRSIYGTIQKIVEFE
jgi:hypothetical protein